MGEDIVVISDIQYAEVWDSISSILPVNSNFLNPNEILRNLVGSISKDQILVINGDQVDFNYSSYNSSKKSNWDSYLKILEKCNGQVYSTLGNHDYRQYPYNFKITGLKHLNVSKKILYKHIKEIGFGKFRFLNEFRAIKKSFPQKHLHKEYYSVEKNEKHLIFLNTGPDNYFSTLRYLFPSSRSVLNKTPTFLTPPISDGLSNNQIEFLKKELAYHEEKEKIIFLHAPPFFSPTNLESLGINGTNINVAINQFNLNYGCFIKNRDKFIQILTASKSNIIVITSHVHIPNQYILDKGTNLIIQANMDLINEKRKDNKNIKFISTLPIGSIEPYNKKIGSLIIGESIKYNIIKDYVEFGNF
jgi:hypothetical protein